MPQLLVLLPALGLGACDSGNKSPADAAGDRPWAVEAELPFKDPAFVDARTGDRPNGEAAAGPDGAFTDVPLDVADPAADVRSQPVDSVQVRVDTIDTVTTDSATDVPMGGADVSTDGADARPQGSDLGRAMDASNSDAGPGLESSKCAAGQVRVHVRDMWSHAVTPTLGIMTDPPRGVTVADWSYVSANYGARAESALASDGSPCTYYSACIPNTVTEIHLEPIHPSGCRSATDSAAIDVSAVSKSREYWIEYTGTSSSLKTDIVATPSVPQGPGKFHVTTDSSTLTFPACQVGIPPKQSIPKDYIRVHFRWPYTDPVKTGYLGAACGDDRMGYSPPPYPTSLNALAGSCDRQALLELGDGKCLWYSLLIAKSDLVKNADTPITFSHPDYRTELRTPDIALPTLSAPLRDEYWIVYVGTRNVYDAAMDDCFALQYSSNAFSVLSENPGPQYPGCGDSVGGTQPKADAGVVRDSSADPCRGDGACCAVTCAVGEVGCASNGSIGTCASGANGCTTFVETTTCSSGLVCGYHESPECFDPNWAMWPMPNSPADVAAGAPTPASLTDNGNGTVTDNVTKLMWQQTALLTNQRFLFDEAVAYCRNLSLGGYSDWRMPTLIEYWSIMDFDRQGPCLDTKIFLGAGSTWFWTATARPGAQRGYTSVSLYDGLPGTMTDPSTTHFDVRCVRR